MPIDIIKYITWKMREIARCSLGYYIYMSLMTSIMSLRVCLWKKWILLYFKYSMDETTNCFLDYVDLWNILSDFIKISKFLSSYQWQAIPPSIPSSFFRCHFLLSCRLFWKFVLHSLYSSGITAVILYLCM